MQYRSMLVRLIESLCCVLLGEKCATEVAAAAASTVVQQSGGGSQQGETKH